MVTDPKGATRRSVVSANRKFYDAVARDYEKIDGRRSSGLEAWLGSGLRDIRAKCPGGRLLDLGAGSGLVTRSAKGIFEARFALDVSYNIIQANRAAFDSGIVADIDRLPFKTGSFDAVTCFSVLHHLYDFDLLVSEVSRVLKPGGVFYSDHDMDSVFDKRFHIPLSIYRKIFDRKRKYNKACSAITRELYDLSEWQERGVESGNIVKLFEREGFGVEYFFHWFGLSPHTDRLFGKRRYSQGWAPLLSFVALKQSSAG